MIQTGRRRLGTAELRDLKTWLEKAGHPLIAIRTACARTLVAGRAIGAPIERETEATREEAALSDAGRANAIAMHTGTLRSGDHLQVDGSVLLLGDVNPGATLSAGADILVWGRLRGVAHAGRDGDRTARISALQLRPVQLRIAELVARGPDDAPPPGMAEQAIVRDGEIRIEPADPGWMPRVTDRRAAQGRASGQGP
ncbi:septum site-determining protein MinC [Synechococcus sp. RSCCF101]|nr:septum site-determining protein MinC [Synechococcus sp. RSCCF101]